MLRMCGVFAEFQRCIIRERINAGLARAKSNGKRLGRPRVDESVEQAIREALRRGDKGMWKIARELGVGVSVVQRVKFELSQT
jgi:DNA invertase Pin-like site-specific DNA recombinase